jgi:hypothetical protein
MTAPTQGASRRGNAGKGRVKGSPNKATAQAREAIANFVEMNVPRFQAWLDKIEKDNGPLVAMRCVQDMIEYHVPRLSRQETVGEGGGPITVVIRKEA